MADDKDIIFKGEGGGNNVVALTLDMSSSGAATFNTSVLLSGTGGLTTTGGNNLTVSGTVADHAGLVFATHSILPAEVGAVASGNIIDLGQNGNEFKSLYLNTSIINDSGFTIDSAGDITFDASGADIFFGASGNVGSINMAANNLTLSSLVNNADMVFKGVDDGSTITALQLDMSAAGRAYFPSGGGMSVEGSTVFNDAGADVDFRVESDTLTHALFLQGSNGFIGIGESSPNNTLDIKASTAVSMELNGGSGNSKNIYFTQGGTTQGKIRTVGDAMEFGIGSSATEVFRITADGVLFNGNTAAANALDDYEEGAWTPVIRDTSAAGTIVAISHVACTYTKIGRIVTLIGSFTRNDTATLTGNLTITGLPFTATGGQQMGGNAWVDNASGDILCQITAGNTSTMFLKSVDAPDSYVTTDDWVNARPIYFTRTYQAS